MKFIINTTNLQSGGGLQVAISLLEEWNGTSTHHEYHVFLSPQIGLLIDKSSFKKNFKFYSFNQNPTSNIVTIFTFYKKLSALENKIIPNAVFTIFGPALWKPKNPHLIGFANGYYLFDKATFIKKKIENNIINRIKYYCRRFFLFNQLKKEGNQYWVESKEAQEKLATAINKPISQIVVIGNTYGRNFKNKIVEKFVQNSRFSFLYLSAYYDHKNFEIIPKVISILKEKNIVCTIIVTLPKTKFERLFQALYNSEYIINIGTIKPQETPQIYQYADAIFMPSLLETFSANYPEAMMAQKPLVASNLNFAKNICGNAALYFNPEDPLDIADKISAIISNVGLRKQLVEEGIKQLQKMETPESRAQKLKTILEQM